MVNLQGIIQHVLDEHEFSSNCNQAKTNQMIRRKCFQFSSRVFTPPSKTTHLREILAQVYDTFMSLSQHYVMINMKFTVYTSSRPQKFIGQLKFRILKMTLIAGQFTTSVLPKRSKKMLKMVFSKVPQEAAVFLCVTSTNNVS